MVAINQIKWIYSDKIWQSNLTQKIGILEKAGENRAQNLLKQYWQPKIEARFWLNNP